MLTIGQSSADTYFRSVFHIMGLWFDKTTTLSYRIYSFILIFALLLPWVICTALGVALSDTLASATQALSTSIPLSVLYAKAMNVYVNNERIQSCLRRVENFHLLDVKEKTYVNNQLSIFFKFTALYVVMCNLAITLICWRVMLLNDPELPIVAWYPFNWQNNNRDFWIAHSIQFYGLLIGANINVACELFPCFFLTVIGCQLEILGIRLQKLNCNYSGADKNENMKITEKWIDDHVKTHYYIVELTEDVQSCYNFPFFLEICTVGVTITATAFQLSFLISRSKLGDHDIPKYSQYIIILCCTVFRILMPCYFGNLVLSASEALPFHLFSSEWLDMLVLCRKKVIILMERMKRPTMIWAWVLFPLTLEVFKSIMNFSYTMLTLLQNFN